MKVLNFDNSRNFAKLRWRKEDKTLKSISCWAVGFDDTDDFMENIEWREKRAVYVPIPREATTIAIPFVKTNDLLTSERYTKDNVGRIKEEFLGLARHFSLFNPQTHLIYKKRNRNGYKFFETPFECLVLSDFPDNLLIIPDWGDNIEPFEIPINIPKA